MDARGPGDLGAPQPGALLAEARRSAGQSLELVAAGTRIRLPHLRAIEAGDFAALPGAVYVRGYVRVYAEHLGLDPAPLLARLPEGHGGISPAVRPLHASPPPRIAITGPALAAVGLILATTLFALYAWRELEAARQEQAPPPAALSPPPIASPQPLPSAAATAPSAPAPRMVSVAVKATEQVWLSVTVDGKPFYGQSGRFLAAGQSDVYVGEKVKISAGKASLLVSLNGGDFVPMGSLTKEYSAQT